MVKGTHCPRNVTTKGSIGQETHHSRDALSRGSKIPDGTFRDTLFGDTSSRHLVSKTFKHTARNLSELLIAAYLRTLPIWTPPPPRPPPVHFINKTLKVTALYTLAQGKKWH